MAEKWTPPPLGPYQYHEVLSSLRKTIKLGLDEEAIYWANVILTFGDNKGPTILAKQLWIMAAEDLDDEPVLMRCYAIMDSIGAVRETDHLYFLVYRMAHARKWWEHEDGIRVDQLWAKAIGDLRSPERQHPIPSYALDRHTRRGWTIFKETGQFDDRYSGTDLGRAKTVYLFQRDGFIDEDGQVWFNRDGSPDDGFMEHWRAYRELTDMTTDEVQPNDPLGKAGLGYGSTLFGEDEA